MSRHRLRTLLTVSAALALIAGGLSAIALPAHAAGAAFTLTVKSAFLRNAPSFSAARAYSIFNGQTFAVLARTADNAWLKLDYAGATGDEAWVWSAYGTWAGDLGLVAVVAASSTETPAPPGGVSLPSPTTHAFFTLSAKSAFLRSAPNASAPRVYSIFKGQSYRLLARTADGAWLRLDYAGATTEAWIAQAIGTVTGDLSGVPVNGDSPSALPTATALPSPAGVLPTVSARAREIYQQGLALGNDPRAFSKIGDCMSVNPYFLTAFDTPGEYRLGADYGFLQETIDHFRGSFSRESQAAHIGFNAQSVFDPVWANPTQCAKGETPIECEFRLHRPSVVLISLGTNGEWLSNDEYETALRRILDFAIGRGVLPILSTKADDLEGGGRFNAIVIRLAADYQLPLWNFRAAVEGLPRRGISTQSAYQLRWGRAFFDTPSTTWTGWQWRNLTALQSLDVVWKAVK